MAEESFVVGQQAIGLAQFYDTRVKTTPTAVTIKMVAVVETEVSSYDGLKCLFVIDVDECESPEANSCHPSSLCTNTEGSYVCRCLRGYSGDGKNCTGKTLAKPFSLRKTPFSPAYVCTHWILH